MIRVAVCDDEKQICEYLKKSVLDCLAKRDLDGRVEIFDDGEGLCRLYENGKADFDIILLDITMKRCDGMTAAKTIRKTDENVMIVFVTASAEYVFSGYQVRAFRYILKPELLHGFAGVFNECLDELTKENELRFSFQRGAQLQVLALRDILYFESDRRKIIIHCTQDREFSFYGKLDEVQNELKNRDFVRCHQSYLVNAKKITAVGLGELSLESGGTLPVSRHRAKETDEAFLWALR